MFTRQSLAPLWKLRKTEHTAMYCVRLVIITSHWHLGEHRRTGVAEALWFGKQANNGPASPFPQRHRRGDFLAGQI